jgi:hypothetical protein
LSPTVAPGSITACVEMPFLSSLIVLYIASTFAKAAWASGTRTRVVFTGAVSSKAWPMITTLAVVPYTYWV